MERIEETKILRYNLATAKTWYVGEPTLIERYYKTEERTLNPYISRGFNATDSFFWKKVIAKYHKTHSGLPRLIVNRIRDLVNTGFEISNEEQETEVETLNEILEDNKFNNILFDKGITDESWAGYTAYKLSFDPTISNMPLIEVVQPEQLEIKTTRGRVTKYIVNFIDDTLNVKQEPTYIEEIYTKIDGVPNIIYKGYTDKDKTTLVDIAFKYEDLELKGLDFLPIFLKPNTSTNASLNMPVGESDFGNSYSLFDDLDECKSQLSHKIRHSNPKRFIAENLIQKNDNGSVLNFNDFETDYIITKEEFKDNNGSLLQQHENKIEAEQYLITYKRIVSQILANVGLSPLTIGDADASGLNNSGETLRERERLSLRTRDGKLKLWKPFLEDMFVKLMQFNDWITKGSIKDYEFTVTFNEFEELSIQELSNNLAVQINSGLLSTKTAIEILNPEFNEDELDKEVIRIKTEQDLNLIADDLNDPNNITQPTT